MSNLKPDKLYLSLSITASSIWGIFLLAYIYKKAKKKYNTLNIIIIFLFLICAGIIFTIITQNCEDFFILGFINTIINIACCSISFNSLLKKNTPKIHLLFILSTLLLISNTMFGLYKFQDMYVFSLFNLIIYDFVQFVLLVLVTKNKVN